MGICRNSYIRTMVLMSRIFTRCSAPPLALAGLFGLLVNVAASEAGAASCQAPKPVCAVRMQVFRIASFDPVGSAVLIGSGLLVTNRHVVADSARANVFLPSGRVIRAYVVPTKYPGDLVLLRIDGLNDRSAPEIASAIENSKLYAVGTDIGTKRVRVYLPGRVILLPAEDKPLARLHHSVPNRPGNSGGALVDGAGRLVGIVTSGGEGLNEAIPSSELAKLRALSGPEYEHQSREIGIAYRECIEALESNRSGQGLAGASVREKIIGDCAKSGNRQLFDLAGQALGRAGRFDAAVAMFEGALAQDSNAINSRLGLVVTLHLERRYRAAIPHLQLLLRLLPSDERILRLSIQAGKLGGNLDYARRALALLEQHHPRLAPRARQFLER